MKNDSIAQLYEHTEFKNIIECVDDLPFPFDTTWSKIAVSVSGGADSALLAYLLAEFCQKHDVELHVISNIRMWKLRPWQEQNAKDVYYWLLERFPKVYLKRHVNFLPPDFEWGTSGPNIIDEYGEVKSGDIIEIRSHAEYIAHKENIDAYFNAVSHNPPIDFSGSMPSRNVEPCIENVNKLITKHMGRVSCHPFRFVNKSWIYRQYIKNNIMDLYTLTRSCEGDRSVYPEVFGNLDYQTYTPGQYVPTCGECFWCKERTWAEVQ